MRQLFVPACLCLMTLSSATGDDPKMSLEQFGNGRKLERMTAAADESEAQLPAIEGETRTTGAEPAVAPIAPIAAPIDIPMQNDSAPAPMLSDSAPAAVATPPLPKAKPEIKPVVYRSTEEVCDTLTRAAQHNGLPVPFFIRLLFQESRFDPGVVSNAGAQGVAQFMPDTASDMGVDNPFDPLQAIPASARLLRNLFDKFGNLGLAAAAYNAGPRRIQDWLAKKGALPQETQGYVKTITGRPAENWKASESGAPAVKLPRHAPCQQAAGLLAWNGPEQIPVPAVAPHRRPKEPVLVAAGAPAHGKADDKKQGGKTDVKVAHHGGRVTATIKVADASGGVAPTAKKETAHKDARKKQAPAKDAKKDSDKKDKGALQLAARRQHKAPHKKVHVSQR